MLVFVCLWSLCCLPVVKIQEIDELKWYTFLWRSWIQCVLSYVSWSILVKLLKFVCNSCKIAEKQEHCWKNKKNPGLFCPAHAFFFFSWQIHRTMTVHSFVVSLLCSSSSSGCFSRTTILIGIFPIWSSIYSKGLLANQSSDSGPIWSKRMFKIREKASAFFFQSKLSAI